MIYSLFKYMLFRREPSPRLLGGGSLWCSRGMGNTCVGARWMGLLAWLDQRLCVAVCCDISFVILMRCDTSFVILMCCDTSFVILMRCDTSSVSDNVFCTFSLCHTSPAGEGFYICGIKAHCDASSTWRLLRAGIGNYSSSSPVRKREYISSGA